MDEVSQLAPQQPAQPETPLQNSNSNWLKTLSIGLGVIGIGLLIGITGYLLATKKSQPTENKVIAQPSPIPNPTANWESYTNTQFGVSFLHPMRWTIVPRDVKTTSNRGELGEPDILEFVAEPKEKSPPIALLIYKNSQDLSIEKLDEQLREGIAGDSIHLVSESNPQRVNPNEIIAYYGGQNTCGPYQCLRYSWKGNNKIFQLILYGGYSEKYSIIFDQIFSTFKFTQ